MQSTRRILFFTSVIFLLFSSLAFASDPSPDSEQEPPEVLSLPLTTRAGEVRAVSYTIDDLYTLISGTTNSTLSTISTRVQNDYTQNYQANQKLGQILTNLTTSNVGDTLTLYGLLGDIQSTTHYYVDGDHDYTLAQLLGMIWSYTQDISYDVSLSSSYLASINNHLSSLTGLLSTSNHILSELSYINWQAVNNTPLGFFHSIDNSDVTGQSVSSFGDARDSYYFSYAVTSPYANLVGNVLDFAVPFYSSSASTEILFRSIYFDNDTRINYRLVYQYMDNHLYHFIVFLLDPIPVSSNVHVVFRLDSGSLRLSYDSSGSISQGYIKSIPFNSTDFHTLLTSLNGLSSDDTLFSIKESVDALRFFLVDRNIPFEEAKDNSEDVINETLDDFTGSGSAAAKASDSVSMKNVSGSLKSGLDSGGSVSGATGVFNSSGDFWGWFTQQNSNYINNPYPVPSVTPTRGSGDDVVDFLTPNSNELQDLLRQGGDER